MQNFFNEMQVILVKERFCGRIIGYPCVVLFYDFYCRILHKCEREMCIL